jgi:hypothetical protein
VKKRKTFCSLSFLSLPFFDLPKDSASAVAHQLPCSSRSVSERDREKRDERKEKGSGSEGEEGKKKRRIDL